MVNVEIQPNGTSHDPATWTTAATSASAVYDELEPLELPESEYRQAARRFLAVLRAVDFWMCSTHSGRPPRKWYPVALALGLGSVCGQTETSVAASLGLSRANISKDVVKVLRLTGLEGSPAWGLKTQEQREIYSHTNGRRRLEGSRLGDQVQSQ